MHYRRYHSCGRQPRRARLVDLGVRGAPALSGDSAQAFLIGRYAAELLRTHFPNFYAAEQVADAIATPWLLLGCAAAFWQLVEVRGLKLRMPGDGMYTDDEISFEATPAATLRAFDGVTAAFMADTVGHYLAMPRPCYYGLGVETMLDDEPDPDVLTATLWRLFEGTPWAVLDMGDATGSAYGGIEDDVAEQIARLKPLPRDTDLEQLAKHLTLPAAITMELSPLALLLYAVGQTGSELADHTDYEVEALHMGELDEGYGWADIDRLAELQAEARRIQHAYDSWALWVSRKPRQAIPKLAGALHTAERAARAARHTPETSLIELLREADLIEEVPV